jgi:hypothetical protein
MPETGQAHSHSPPGKARIAVGAVCRPRYRVKCQLGFRWCPQCQQEKSVNEFSRAKSKKYGLGCYCKACACTRSKNYRLSNPATANVRPAYRAVSSQPGFRICTACKSEKPSEEFVKDSRILDGMSVYCKVCKKQRRKLWKLKNPHKGREYILRNKYGIEPEDYKKMYLSQKGLCAICKQPSPDKPLCVDHNHITGIVRGLLCDSCNLLLGCAHDDTQTLAEAILYLKGAQ